MREIERLFYKHRIGHLPILKDKRLVGIVSRRDYLECTMRPNVELRGNGT
jgi:tRNA nucleotidyltransferase (CCA-adding enzyme)